MPFSGTVRLKRINFRGSISEGHRNTRRPKTSEGRRNDHPHIRPKRCPTHISHVDPRLQRLDSLVVEEVQLAWMYSAKNILLASKSKRSRAGDTGTIGHIGNRRILWQFWPRTDKAHVSAQDVIELRKLIQLEFPKPESNPGYTAIPPP